MSVLPDHYIDRLCREIKLVEPYDPHMVQPASIDLTLGENFVVSDDGGSTEPLDMANVQDNATRQIVVPKGSGLRLMPLEFVLGHIEERVTLPDSIVSRIEGKSSVGRLGVLTHVTAGFVDPGWDGRLTLEICNLRKRPIILRPGLPFCQMAFEYLTEPAARPYNGRYQGDDTVAHSRYGKDPTNEDFGV